MHLLSFWLITMNHKDLSISDAGGRISHIVPTRVGVNRIRQECCLPVDHRV